MGQQSHSVTITKLNRIAWLSKQDSSKEFECLMHLFNKESLLECFHSLDGKKAAGISGMTKSEYAENLDGNIEKLYADMKKMAYRPKPVREVLIPKEGKSGATRPLGISEFEDKIVQKMMQRVLESIYSTKLNPGIWASVKAPAVERSKETPYYNMGSLSIDSTPGL